MILFYNLLFLLSLSSADVAPAVKPLLSEEKIQSSIEFIKKQQKIPEAAIEIVFDFYRKNRQSVGGLKNKSCIDQKKYKIRYQDPKMNKKYLKEGIENESCLCIMDYTKPATQERGHCIFLDATNPPQIESFFVAHGRGSKTKEGKPTAFTNSLKPTGTTLSGLFLTAKDLYRFQGEALMKYQSTGLGLYGVEVDNWTASNVGKVTHGAPYVIDEPGKVNVGESLGCPAMPMEKAKSILPRCKGKAAWLNYTEVIKDRKNYIPQSCN